MFQKKDGDVPESDTVAPEERAYEDNWYRSLKALSEQRQDEEAGTVETEVSEDAPVDVAGHPVDVGPEEPLPAQIDDAEPVASEPAAAATATDRERLVSQEFEARAGRLLERLRSIQSSASESRGPA